MTLARNIQFTPRDGAQPPERQPKSRGYTRLDNATDLRLLGELPNALVKPALFLMSRRCLRQPGARWPEIAEFSGRSQTQIAEALSKLAALGLAESDTGLWVWIDRKPGENIPGFARKPGMGVPKNAVSDNEKQPSELKELKELKEEEHAGAHARPESGPDHLPHQAAEAAHPTAPDGAAADAAGADLPPPSPVELGHDPQGGENVTDDVKSSAPAAGGYRAAMDAISGAGLLPTWRNWVRLTRALQVTQEAHAALWAGWIGAGRAAHLGEQAAHIIEAGHYAHPLGALKKRMADAASGPAPLERVPVERPTLRAGQRVRYPDGSEATIVAVRSRGVTTDHADFPDVPLARVRSLEVLA